MKVAKENEKMAEVGRVSQEIFFRSINIFMKKFIKLYYENDIFTQRCI